MSRPEELDTAPDTCEEAASLLSSDKEQQLEIESPEPVHCFRQFAFSALAVHTVLIFLYTSIFVFLVYHTSGSLISVLSPANQALEYEVREFFPVTYNNPFTGKPRPELETAWHDLLKYSHIRVSKAELQAANQTSLIFQDGSGYIAQLASTHQLHCIKQIRHYLHHEHYFPNASKDVLKAQAMHVDHCLELLRLATMCAGDTSLTPFYFAQTDDGLLYPFVKSRTYHHCVNWDRLEDWSKHRSVNLFDPSLLDLPPGAKRLLPTPLPSMVIP